MKIKLAFALASTVMLVGCSAPSTQEPSPQETVVETVVVTPDPPKEDPAPEEEGVEDLEMNKKVFVQVMRENTSVFDEYSDEELIDIGMGLCIVFDIDGFEPTIQAIINETPEDELEDAGFMVGAAINSFCPQYLDDLGDML